MEETVLLKAGKETCVRFELEGIDAASTQNMAAADIFQQASGVRPAGMFPSCFYRNLLRIDSNLPLMYAGLIYLYYNGNRQNYEMREMVGLLAEENKLRFSEKWLYEDKMQKLLVELAYGMNAESEWDGGYQQIVRSVILKKEEKTYRFLGGEKQEFGQFLVENCEIYGSGKRDGLETVYEQNGRYYMNLAVNIVI